MRTNEEGIPAVDEQVVTVPYDQEAEQALLGIWLSDTKDHKSYLEAPVAPALFYFDEHVTIAQVVHDYVLAGKITDPVVVAAELRKRNKLDEVGGMAYLRKLTQIVSTTQNNRVYADLIKETATKRKIMQAGRDAYESAFNPGTSVAELQQNLAKALDAIDQPQEVTLHDMAEKAIAEMKDVKRSSDHWPKCGIAVLDKALGGFRPGGCTVLAGYSGQGKSSLAEYAVYMASKRDHPTAYISLEMNWQELFNRCEAIEGVACNSDMNRGRDALTTFELAEYERVGRDIIAPLKMYFLDSIAPTPEAVLTEIRRQRVIHNVELFVIDYLQLIQPANNREGNYNLFLSNLTAQLKGIARTMNCHIIELSQVSRDAFKTGRELTMHDLRDSGSIEQNSDNVLLLNQVDEDEGNDTTTHVILNVAKQRSGSNNQRILLEFDKDHQTWTGVETGSYNVPTPIPQEHACRKRVRKQEDQLSEHDDVPFN